MYRIDEGKIDSMEKYEKQKYDIFKKYVGAPLGNKNVAKNPVEVRRNHSFKASDHEWQQIKENAKKVSMTVSEYIRLKAC